MSKLAIDRPKQLTSQLASLPEIQTGRHTHLTYYSNYQLALYLSLSLWRVFRPFIKIIIIREVKNWIIQKNQVERTDLEPANLHASKLASWLTSKPIGTGQPFNSLYPPSPPIRRLNFRFRLVNQAGTLIKVAAQAVEVEVKVTEMASCVVLISLLE